MSKYPQFMKSQMPIRWFIMVNRVDAEIFQKMGKAQFTSVKKMSNPEGALREHELVADKPGRVFSNASLKGQVRHSLDRRMQHHEQSAKRFVGEVAAYVNTAYNEGRFDELVLVAEPRMLGILRKSLPKGLKKVIWREIPREYNRGSELERKEHLRNLVSTLLA